MKSLPESAAYGTSDEARFKIFTKFNNLAQKKLQAHLFSQEKSIPKRSFPMTTINQHASLNRFAGTQRFQRSTPSLAASQIKTLKFGEEPPSQILIPPAQPANNQKKLGVADGIVGGIGAGLVGLGIAASHIPICGTCCLGPMLWIPGLLILLGPGKHFASAVREKFAEIKASRQGAS